MSNIIYDDNTDNTIGFYQDLKAELIKNAKDWLDEGDFEQVQTCAENLQELEQYREFDGLLVLSENNGMGFTCSPYKGGE